MPELLRFPNKAESRQAKPWQAQPTVPKTVVGIVGTELDLSMRTSEGHRVAIAHVDGHSDSHGH